MKPIGNYFKYTLLALWLIALAGLIYLGIVQANEHGYDGRNSQKHIGYRKENRMGDQRSESGN